MTAGVKTEAKSSVSIRRNRKNPTSCLAKAGDSARGAVKMAGKGSWKKQRPSCNGADRSDALLRKRADFRQVVGDEKSGRTFAGGNSK